MTIKSSGFFDFIFWRIAYANDAYWKRYEFADSEWIKIGFGFYWRTDKF